MLHRAGPLLRKLDRAERERRDHRPVQRLFYIPPGLRAGCLSFPALQRDSNACSKIADPGRLLCGTARSLHHTVGLLGNWLQDRQWWWPTMDRARGRVFLPRLRDQTGQRPAEVHLQTNGAPSRNSDLIRSHARIPWSSPRNRNDEHTDWIPAWCELRPGYRRSPELSSPPPRPAEKNPAAARRQNQKEEYKNHRVPHKPAHSSDLSRSPV